jgi:hypothetical protein
MIGTSEEILFPGLFFGYDRRSFSIVVALNITCSGKFTPRTFDLIEELYCNQRVASSSKKSSRVPIELTPSIDPDFLQPAFDEMGFRTPCLDV